MTDDLPQLVQRLTDLAARYDMSHTERYEVDSEAFYAETGYMAPGKDVPMAMGGQDEAERRAAHEAWIMARNQQQQQTLRDAADALDTFTRALAAQQEAHRREGNEWVEAMFNTTTEMDRLRESLSAMTQERDEARWKPLEDYHKRHVPGCRKHMYDPKSSPCTCVTEWESEQVRADANERWARESADKVTAAVREARAETWEQAAKSLRRADAVANGRHIEAGSAAVGRSRRGPTALVADLFDERATAARTGQP